MTTSDKLRGSVKSIVCRMLGARLRLPRSSTAPTALLTFDDGPQEKNTRQTLDRLDEVGARGLFFLTGIAIEKAPDLPAEIIQRGHAVGNHTYSHVVDRSVRSQAYGDDVQKCQDAIQQAIGSTPRYFRPPLGAMRPASILAARRAKLRIVLWSVDGQDWRLRTDPDPDAPTIGRRLGESIEPADIVLLHDYHDGIGPLLEQMLPRLRDRGFDLSKGVDMLG